ncbi:hypothetical protein [Listeria booriae]|uniref:hypothetical protein n=1 Tax=Listeria booriae TaxID=1552123 RepID=UPI001628DB30|nr:hypothetical protein [Listeria booriae]MBC2386403.1 hypothetical protein [Listeria booriae]
MGAQCECGSKRIFHLRIDTDWAFGTGEYYPENDDKYYSEEDLEKTADNRPDIYLYHCLDCDKLWEQY